MAARATVTCPAGHPVATTVRARGTTCPVCRLTFYVRADGTTGDRGQLPGRAAPGEPGSSRAPRRGDPYEPPASPDDDEPGDLADDEPTARPAPASPAAAPTPARRRRSISGVRRTLPGRDNPDPPTEPRRRAADPYGLF